MCDKALYWLPIMLLIIISVTAYLVVPGNNGQVHNRLQTDGVVFGYKQTNTTHNRPPGGQVMNQQGVDNIPQAPATHQQAHISLTNQNSQNPGLRQDSPVQNQVKDIQDTFRPPVDQPLPQIDPIPQEQINKEKNHIPQSPNNQIAPPSIIEQESKDNEVKDNGKDRNDNVNHEDHPHVPENPNAVPPKEPAVDQLERNPDTQRIPNTQAQKTTRYEANWESLDARPLPSWYDEAKFGIFIHWGVFSVPAFGSEKFWYKWKHFENPEYVKHVQNNYWPGFKYPDFAPKFTAEFYNATEWADLFEAAGAKYVVLTSKHHEGFTNWPSKVSFNWNSLEAGPGKDLVGELASAVKAKRDMKFGVYHSLYEWFNPLYLTDKQNQYQTQYFVASKVLPCLYELVNAYEPEIVWSDGDWEALSTYWRSTDFLSWLYNESPVRETVVTNDRWGNETVMKHGGFYTGLDRLNPGHVLPHKWENCMTIDRKSWGFRKNAPLGDYLTMDELIDTLVETVSCGGNLLMNIGPSAEGRIAPIYEERLRQMGTWLRVNGEAIYATKPWRAQNDTVAHKVWYTSKRQSDGRIAVYAIMLEWPKGNTLTLGVPVSTRTTTVTMLGLSQSIGWTSRQNRGLDITLPALAPPDIPCYWAWVLKLTDVQ